MTGLRGVVLTVRFLCELGLLVALGAWGFASADGALGVVAGIGAPLAVAVFWGLFLSPKAPWPMPIQVRLMTEFFVFGFGALALNDVGQPFLALAFGAAAFGTSLLNASYQRSSA